MESRLNFSLPQLLKVLMDQKGSDLHITAMSPPRVRINGELLPLEVPDLSEADTSALCLSVLTEEQKKQFDKNRELDFAFNVKNLSRFRGNIFLQRGAVGGVFRLIPMKIPTIEELSLPNILVDLCKKPRGLVLVTGPTGSGKTTTLAAMINFINDSFTHHILTIEDPIEYVHTNKRCLINQREVGYDTDGFARALKSAMRQDPDVILVGELRDQETISMALTASETGHLVLGTLHTNSCVSSINRILDVFPAHQQSQVRTQLSFSLVGVLSQTLIKGNDGKLAVCFETLIPNSAIRNLIRDDKVHQIYSSMQIGQEGSGMQTMNQGLLNLVIRKKITINTALALTQDIAELSEMFKKANLR